MLNKEQIELIESVAIAVTKTQIEASASTIKIIGDEFKSFQEKLKGQDGLFLTIPSKELKELFSVKAARIRNTIDSIKEDSNKVRVDPLFPESCESQVLRQNEQTIRVLNARADYCDFIKNHLMDDVNYKIHFQEFNSLSLFDDGIIRLNEF